LALSRDTIGDSLPQSALVILLDTLFAKERMEIAERNMQARTTPNWQCRYYVRVQAQRIVRAELIIDARAGYGG